VRFSEDLHMALCAEELAWIQEFGEK
jgi:hypothetical protein